MLSFRLYLNRFIIGGRRLDREGGLGTYVPTANKSVEKHTSVITIDGCFGSREFQAQFQHIQGVGGGGAQKFSSTEVIRPPSFTKYLRKINTMKKNYQL